MKKRVYISGAISDLSISDRKLNFLHAEIFLMQVHDIHPKNMVNPLNIKPLFGINNWYCHMIVDIIVLVLFCNQIALQPNWESSRGARIEKRIAEFLNYKVIKLWVEK